MKRKNLLFYIVLMAPMFMFGQKAINATDQFIIFEIQGSSGTNGSAVAYHPQHELYYASIAGNASYPLEAFNEMGNFKYTESAGSDLRGIWYNKKAKALQANCYNDGGIISINVSENGAPTGKNEVIFDGENHQPDENAVGTIDPKAKEIIYFTKGYVRGYSLKTGLSGKTYIKLKAPVESGNLNSTTVIYTGQKKMEYGLLDFEKKKVYLFDKKTGEHTASVILPSNAVTFKRFRFSYANGYVFLFDAGKRVWTGYKAF